MRALLILVVLAALAVIVFGLWRARQAQIRQQRHAAWRAKRAEEDRIWYEKMGETPPEN